MARRSLRSSVPTRHTTGIERPRCVDRLPSHNSKTVVPYVVMDLGVPHAIIRPTLVFGAGDLLLNNIAWALRRFPVFPVYGSGDCPVRPVFADDLAAPAVEAGSLEGNSISEAAGPETFSFEELIHLLASAMGVRSRLMHTPPSAGHALTRLVGLLTIDPRLSYRMRKG